MKKNNTDITTIKPYNQEENKTTQLSRMFNTISKKYDLFNDMMTFGLARVWRKKALLSLRPYPHNHILDIATGTADIAIQSFQYLKPTKITGIDISEEMLAIGKEKVKKSGLTQQIMLQVGDVSQLDFQDDTFDATITAFGIRNFDQLEKSIKEIHRVLKPNGKFIILEMNEPQTPIIKQGYTLFVKTLIPLMVKALSNDPKAYNYLTESMKAFPQGKALIQILNNHHFQTIKYQKLFLGVCSLYVMEKQQPNR